MTALLQLLLAVGGLLIAADGLDGAMIAFGYKVMTIDEWLHGGPMLLWSYHAPPWVHVITLAVGAAMFAGFILWARHTNRRYWAERRYRKIKKRQYEQRATRLAKKPPLGA